VCERERKRERERLVAFKVSCYTSSLRPHTLVVSEAGQRLLREQFLRKQFRQLLVYEALSLQFRFSFFFFRRDAGDEQPWP
jgi:hypothetical protein